MDLKDIRLYVDDRPAEGVFRVHRDVYSDPELFELEQKFIFERSWNFLGLESQLPKANDFITGWIGRTPVLVTRDARGALGAFVNVCRHKGVMLCGAEEGNAKYHVCPYHGWAYDASGKNIDIKDRKSGCYAPGFDAESHDLVPLARAASYKGLVFGSLSSEVPPLEEFLGDMRFFIDLVADQGADGMEFIPGRSVYTYRGNWKLQLDNGLDPYHLTTTHLSYMDLQARRRGGRAIWRRANTTGRSGRTRKAGPSPCATGTPRPGSISRNRRSARSIRRSRRSARESASCAPNGCSRRATFTFFPTCRSPMRSP